MLTKALEAHSKFMERAYALLQKMIFKDKCPEEAKYEKVMDMITAILCLPNVPSRTKVWCLSTFPNLLDSSYEKHKNAFRSELGSGRSRRASHRGLAPAPVEAPAPQIL